MKIAIVGSSGYIAEYLLKRFSKEPMIESVLKLDHIAEGNSFLELQNAESFDYALLDDIDQVIFTAAISSPDKCAKDFDVCWAINVTGTSYFIKKAMEKGCRVLFFSSDAVFGDIPGAIYTETSETKANTPYGRMKKAIEDEFRDQYLFKAIRLSYVVSVKDRFMRYCLECIETDQIADIFHPFYRNVISVSDVVDVVMFFIKRWGEYKPTFLNVAGKELVSRIRIVDELNRCIGGKLNYTVSMPDNGFFANRSQITQMKSLYINKYKIIPDNTFTEKLAKELEDVKI